MKYLIVSDIHGSLSRLNKVIEFFNENNMDMLVILGDIMNYGPRNGLPEGLDAKGVANRLNEMADRIIAIRGNCDSEVDQMLLEFPMLSDYTMLVDNGVKLFLTHGHIYNKENMPKAGIDAFIFGHTHLLELKKDEKVTICNTGSITFPKNGNPPSFATYEEGKLRLHHLDGRIVEEVIVK